VNKLAKRIERQHMVVAARVDELEFARLVKSALGVAPVKQKSFNLCRRVQRVLLFLIELLGEGLQHAAHVAGIRRAILVDDVAEHQYLAVAKHVCRNPVERAPVDAQAQVRFLLRGKAADRRSVERQVLISAEQELLVVVEKMQAAFQVAEEN